jgi:hypothetical protein
MIITYASRRRKRADNCTRTNAIEDRLTRDPENRKETLAQIKVGHEAWQNRGGEGGTTR